MARFTSDVGNMNWAMTEMMMSVPRQFVLLLVYLGLALWASWRLALITLLIPSKGNNLNMQSGKTSFSSLRPEIVQSLPGIIQSIASSSFSNFVA